MIILKQLKWLILPFIMVLMNACCSKKNCDDHNFFGEIKLICFPAKEIDTVYIRSFLKNSVILLDSFITTAHFAGSGDSSLEISHPFYANLDYLVEIPCYQVSYKIAGFTFGKEVCNQCFLIQHDYYEELKSYKVNETWQYADFLYLTR